MRIQLKKYALRSFSGRASGRIRMTRHALKKDFNEENALRSFTGRARGRIGMTRHSSLKKVMDHSDTAGRAELWKTIVISVPTPIFDVIERSAP